jgi:hypothetical protein
MAALHDLVTSERFAHLLGRIESHAESLLAKEMKDEGAGGRIRLD